MIQLNNHNKDDHWEDTREETIVKDTPVVIPSTAIETAENMVTIESDHGESLVIERSIHTSCEETVSLENGSVEKEKVRSQSPSQSNEFPSEERNGSHVLEDRTEHHNNTTAHSHTAEENIEMMALTEPSRRINSDPMRRIESSGSIMYHELPDKSHADKHEKEEEKISSHFFETSLRTSSSSSLTTTTSACFTSPSPILYYYHVHARTPILQADASLRILRKFISKTSPFVPVAFGGEYSPSLFQRLFFSNSNSSTTNIHRKDSYPSHGKLEKSNNMTKSSSTSSVNPNHPDILHVEQAAGVFYHALVTLLMKNQESSHDNDTVRKHDDDVSSPDEKGMNSSQRYDSDTIETTHDATRGRDDKSYHADETSSVPIERIFGRTGDTMSKSKLAVGLFCTLVECWSSFEWNSSSMPIHDAIPTTTATSSSATTAITIEAEKEDQERCKDGGGTLSQAVEKKKKRVHQHYHHHIYKSHTPSSTFVTTDLISTAWESVNQLIAHGCFDAALLQLRPVELCTNDTTPFSVMNSAHISKWIESFIQLKTENYNSGLNEKDFDVSLEDLHEQIYDDNYGIQHLVDQSEDDDDYGFTPLETAVPSSPSKNRNHRRIMYRPAVSVSVDSIFSCVLTTDRVELSALKVLLTTGCRSLPSAPRKNEIAQVDGQPLLSGRRLLLSIKICHRVFLQTESMSNRTTARATLRQLVAAAFTRLEVRSSSMGVIKTDTTKSEGNSVRIGDTGKSHVDLSLSNALYSFPEYKDAFLMLRSLCVLTMKSLSTPALMNRGSSSTRDSGTNALYQVDTKTSGSGTTLGDPSLDSKILGLELLLEVLTRKGTATLLSTIPQLIYAVRHYLCYSLLSNSLSSNNTVVSLSLKIFVPLIHNCRQHLKTEIEAFVTNVFFVILDSKNAIIEHKFRVVKLFEDICSDPITLAEIFLNYDCDLSAVDLFQRIVNSLAKVAKFGLDDKELNAGTRAEKLRQDQRTLRLEGMRAIQQVLASLNASIISPIKQIEDVENDYDVESKGKITESNLTDVTALSLPDDLIATDKQSLVQIYDSKKKRKEEETRAMVKFNQKPTAGIKYASQVGLVQGDDPADVATFLISNNDVLDKTRIGEYLGREPEFQDGFALRVLHHYVSQLDFTGLLFDEAIRFYLSGFRLPGEAQKIDRIMEKFAERYTIQNPDVFPSADCAFILAFSIIMLNTDLHNPAIKEERRMTRDSFIRNNRGVADGKDLPEELLISIFERIKKNPISLKEDDEARAKVGGKRISGDRSSATNVLNPAPFFGNSIIEMDKAREHNYQKERDEIVRNTVLVLRRRKSSKTFIDSLNIDKGSDVFVRTQDSGLQDEYVTPMFDVTWGPALSVFSTAMESANGTMGSLLLSVASDEEIELAAENAATTIEVCIEGFETAISVAGVCGNDTARSAFVHALSNFSLLGTGRLLEGRQIRCVQALLEIGLDYGEILGNSWEYIFRALSEVARLRHVYEVVIRSKREAEIREREPSKVHIRPERSDQSDLENEVSLGSNESRERSYNKSNELFEEEMDKRAIDEANAMSVYENISEDLINGIYLRSASLSIPALKDFIFQLCRVSRLEISGYGGHHGSQANDVDLTAVHYFQQHTLLSNNSTQNKLKRHYNQPDIHSLQRLIEVTHYNMEARPRLVFSELWSVVSSHLTSTALHSNAAVAIYAVDSFRQLSIHFLNREELGVFEFQRRFLKPFESIMLRSDAPSVKEYLLKCLEQIILIHGFGCDTDMKNMSREIKTQLAGLKSAWRPILTVMGLAGHDAEDSVAKLAFSMLTEQLQRVISMGRNEEYTVNKDKAELIRSDYFIDLIDALLMFVSGPRDELSTLCIDHIKSLSQYLADENISCPAASKQRRVTHVEDNCVNSGIIESSDRLGLWWPILLGLSKSVGDCRDEIRNKSLDTLFSIINKNFFGSAEISSESFDSNAVANETLSIPQNNELQTLQLIFKGILAPTLEHVDMGWNELKPSIKLPLPDGFVQFRSKSQFKADDTANTGRKERIERVGDNFLKTGNNWVDKTFSILMDGFISLVLRSLIVFRTDDMIEEMFAIIHTCLMSDTGVIAVRGLKYLYQFITNDLPINQMSDDTWGTVCHLLKSSLAVRGLPDQDRHVYRVDEPNIIVVDKSAVTVDDFILQEELLADRRYIGSYAVMIIESLLSDKQSCLSMGPRWYSFLLSGLGSGIIEWDQADSIIKTVYEQNASSSKSSAPTYAENALYGRRAIMHLLTILITEYRIFSEFRQTPPDSEYLFSDGGNLKSLRKIVKHELESLLVFYVSRELLQSVDFSFMTPLVLDLADMLNSLDDGTLSVLLSLGPVLTSCMQVNDRTVRSSVYRVLQRVLRLSQYFEDPEENE